MKKVLLASVLLLTQVSQVSANEISSNYYAEAANFRLSLIVKAPYSYAATRNDRTIGFEDWSRPFVWGVDKNMWADKNSVIPLMGDYLKSHCINTQQFVMNWTPTPPDQKPVLNIVLTIHPDKYSSDNKGLIAGCRFHTGAIFK